MADLESIERMHYFNTQFLVADDFIAEQNYHRQMRYRHALEMHTAGVVRGLEVSQDGALQIEVSDGMAVDGAGREIVLFEAEKIALADIDGFETGTTKYLYVKLAEKMAGGSSLVEGEEQWTRRLEVPGWILESIYPSESTEEVPLAKIVLSESEITEIEDRRIFAGPRIPDGSIGEEKIATGAVTVEKLDEDFELGSDQIADEAVGNDQLAPGAITVEKLEEDFELDKDHIAQGAVDTGQLAPGAVTVEKLDENFELGSDRIADGAVGNGQLAPGAVTVDKLDEEFVLGADHIDANVLTSAAAYVTFDEDGGIINAHNVERVRKSADHRYTIEWNISLQKSKKHTRICWAHSPGKNEDKIIFFAPGPVVEEDYDVQDRRLTIKVLGFFYRELTPDLGRPSSPGTIPEPDGKQVVLEIRPVDSAVSIVIF